ncbi:hypothetical protein [Rhizobium mongolense]
MSDQSRRLIERREKIEARIASVVAEETDAVLAGGECSNGDEVLRLCHERDILDAAIERLRNAS